MARRQLPFLVFAPGFVVVLGVLTAVAVGAIGVRDLRTQSDEAASLRARVLSRALGARLQATPNYERASVIERAARRSGAELLLVKADGRIIVDASLGAPSRDHIVDLLVEGEGETVTQLGRTRYAVTPMGRPVGAQSLISFVNAPETPFATASLISSVAILTAILIGAAALVAFAFARDVHMDVTYVRHRIEEMAATEGAPVVRQIPVRSADQVGVLTSAFNELAARFSAAELAYRRDLAGALAYDRERSAFLAALSHELRTPLNAILGFTEVLLSEVDGPLRPEARENLEVVRASGRHLAELVDDILELSALESGELRLSRVEVDVHELAEEVVREAAIAAQGKPLTVKLEGGSAPAWADARRVRQILGNVVGNAVKFTSAGTVRVRISSEQGCVLVDIADTGPGIAPDDQAAIFEEYQQSGDARSRRTGTGLGLAITRRLVKMHGGAILLESALGRGSRFRIVLPSRPDGSIEPLVQRLTRKTRRIKRVAGGLR
jgi:signal transduction histidine kinase